MVAREEVESPIEQMITKEVSALNRGYHLSHLEPVYCNRYCIMIPRYRRTQKSERACCDL